MTRAVILLLVVLAASSHGLADDGFAGFAVISTENPSALQSRWEPLIEDLSQHAGKRFKLLLCNDYAGVVWALRSGRALVAHLGNKSAIEAVDNAGAEVGLKIEGAMGPGYHSVILARRDGPVTDVESMFAKASSLTFAQGDPNSTSGSLVPGYFLFTSRNADPARIFMRVRQGNHEENFLAVAGGAADVATCNDSSLKRFASRYPEQAERVRVIWRSPLIPSDPIVWRKDMPESLKLAIAGFLEGYGRERPGKPAETLRHEQEVLAGMKLRGFAASDDSQLLVIRLLQLAMERERLAADNSMPSGQRQRRIEAIDESVLRLRAMAGMAAP